MKGMRQFFVLIVLALVMAPAALGAGGGAAENGYGGAGNVQEQLGQSGQAGAAGENASGGGLPFTGLDLALLVVGGTALLIVGTTLRRAGRRSA